MKKTLLRSTFLLILVSIIAKILSFLVRIFLARNLSVEAMNYYTLASPTMVFVITLAQMGIPGALSKVIAQSHDIKKPLLVSVLVSLLNNIIIIAGFLIVLPFLSVYILKQREILPVLYAILPLIPFVTLSGILKGYLFGIQHHVQATGCQIFEESSRILFLFIMFSSTTQLSAINMARIAMLSISVGEMCSAAYMLFAMHLHKHNVQQLPSLLKSLHRQQFDEVLAISIPMTGSRLIGSLTYFLEPIVMIIGLSAWQSDTMIHAYGQLNGYVLPIITMPSFLTITLSNFLLPSFTYHYARGHEKQAHHQFTFILGSCFLVGIMCSVLCYFFNEELLMLFYHNTRGAFMLKQLAWPFALYSLQPPLSSMLHALSLSKKTVLDTFAGSFLRLLCVAFLSRIFMADALIIALSVGMLVTTLSHAIRLHIALNHT